MECFHFGTVGDQNIFAAFYGGLVLDDAVLGNAHAVKSGTQRAQTAHHQRAFQCADDITDNGSREEQRADTGNKKKGGAEQQAPETAPKRTRFSPVFYAVASVVIADHMFIGVVVAANDGEFFHVKAGLLEFLDCRFGFEVGFENRHRAIVVGHKVGSFILHLLHCHSRPVQRLRDGVFTPLFTLAKRDSFCMAKL